MRIDSYDYRTGGIIDRQVPATGQHTGIMAECFDAQIARCHVCGKLVKGRARGVARCIVDRNHFKPSGVERLTRDIGKETV